MKKLYEVTIEYTYYAYAHDEEEAESYADTAMQDAFPSDFARGRLVRPRASIAAGWDELSRVYHSEREDEAICLGDVWPKGGKR